MSSSVAIDESVDPAAVEVELEPVDDEEHAVIPTTRAATATARVMDRHGIGGAL
jgi:hypothetical protein